MYVPMPGRARSVKVMTGVSPAHLMVTGTGILSLAFGLVVAYQIGVVDGLFSSHPSWTPR